MATAVPRYLDQPSKMADVHCNRDSFSFTSLPKTNPHLKILVHLAIVEFLEPRTQEITGDVNR